MQSTSQTLGVDQPTKSAHRLVDSQWIGHAWFTASGALVAELTTGDDLIDLLRRSARWPGTLFLDSATGSFPRASVMETDPAAGLLDRYSFLAVDPFEWLVIDREKNDAAAIVENAIAAHRSPTIPGLPPFQGGVAGLLAYDFGLISVGVNPPKDHIASIPLVVLGSYDVVFAVDHVRGRGWMISQGLPALGPVERRRRALRRAAQVLDRLQASDYVQVQKTFCWPPAVSQPLQGHESIAASCSRNQHLDRVRQTIEKIRDGDVFQVNLAQTLAAKGVFDPVELYLRLREENAAPFAGYFDCGDDLQVASASPERFLQVVRSGVRMHPIKGTRRIIERPEADLFAAGDLESSAKDRAENVMIVDLVRNDLSKVCMAESVTVEVLCRLERYRYVQHLVSVVSGRLRQGLGPLDAVREAVPGGSVTGAPKQRACEIISELEQLNRGAYCGSLGYVGFDGVSDWNLLIRTFTVNAGYLWFAVGGGITAASDPSAEYDETLHKAEGMIRALAVESRAEMTGRAQ